MNLIKVQNELRDLPLQAVKAYADGKSPSEVPEWLATAEMKRRERLANSGAVAPQKSVKEQVEEKMGLKALQAMRQQQAMQQMGQQAQASPTIPENVPQPEEQPQPEPQMAASGGLMSGIAKLPVGMFNKKAYAGGGIIAFDGEDGSTVEDPRLKNRDARLPIQTGGPGYDALMKELSRAEEVVPTEEDLMAKRQAMLTKLGIKPIGEGQEQRMAQREEEYKQGQKDRALENFSQALAAYARPNITGRGIAAEFVNPSVRSSQAARAEDIAFKQAQDKARDAIEAGRRAELVNDVDGAMKARQELLKAQAEMRRAKMQAAGQAAQTEETARGHGLQYLASTASTAAQLEQLRRDPEAVRTAKWLQEQDPTLTNDQALLKVGQSQSGYLGKELSIEQQKEKLVQDKYEKQRVWSEQMIDLMRKKDPQKAAEYEAANAALMKKLRKEVFGEGAVSSGGGGAAADTSKFVVREKGSK